MSVQFPRGFDRSPKVVYRVRTAETGVKVTRFDGWGLPEGLWAKEDPVRFYGDDAREDAHEWAEEQADDEIDADVIGLGEVWE